MSKRIFCLVISFLLAISVMNAFAETDLPGPAQPRYTYTWEVFAGLNISGTTATCLGKGRGMYSDTTTHVLVRLQQKSSESSYWTTIASWTATANGTGTALVSETNTVTTGYSYRVVVRCQIKDSSGTILEMVYRYSSVWTI